ncbi:MAG: hypothetical protein U1E43_07445 [Rhodospirillales bacterium]
MRDGGALHQQQRRAIQPRRHRVRLAPPGADGAFIDQPPQCRFHRLAALLEAGEAGCQPDAVGSVSNVGEPGETGGEAEQDQPNLNPIDQKRQVIGRIEPRTFRNRSTKLAASSISAPSRR